MFQKLSGSPGCCIIMSRGLLGTIMSASSSILHCDYGMIFILSEVFAKIKSFFKCIQSIALKTILEQGIVQILILSLSLFVTLLGQKLGGIHFPCFDLPTMSSYSSKGIHWKHRGYGVKSMRQMLQEKVFESDIMWVMPAHQLLDVT